MFWWLGLAPGIGQRSHRALGQFACSVGRATSRWVRLQRNASMQILGHLQTETDSVLDIHVSHLEDLRSGIEVKITFVTAFPTICNLSRAWRFLRSSLDPVLAWKWPGVENTAFPQCSSTQCRRTIQADTTRTSCHCSRRLEFDKLIHSTILNFDILRVETCHNNSVVVCSPNINAHVLWSFMFNGRRVLSAPHWMVPQILHTRHLIQRRQTAGQLKLVCLPRA